MAEHAQEQGVWERQEGEPERYYAWFHLYLLLGSQRSLLAAYKLHRGKSGKVGPISKVPPKTPHDAPPQWREIAKLWQWEKRAEEWDREQHRKEEAKWEDRRNSVREDGFAVYEQMLGRAKRMLDWPLTRTTTSKDGKHITIEPTDWSQHTAIRMAKEGTQIGRLACDLFTEKIGRDVAKMSDEEALTAVLRELDVLGYDVRKRSDEDGWDDEEEDKPVSIEAMMDALRAAGYMVLPPLKKAEDG